MEEYKERVVDEKHELDVKLEKLRLFFSTSIFNNIDSDEQDRLNRQEVMMTQYSKILGERIENF